MSDGGNNRNAGRSNSRVVLVLLGVILAMGAGAWAAVPLYDWFCRTTGFAGTVSTAAIAPDQDHVLERMITVRFDANTAPGMAWKFKPVQKKMQLHIGETGLAFYEAYNPTDRVIAGTAAFNVAPEIAGGYFTKIECFCFTEQILQPGERVEMPVTFFVDPDMLQDRDSRFLKEITLSYTFFETELPEEKLSQLALEPEAGQTSPTN